MVIIMKYKIEIVDKYRSSTGNIEYSVCEYDSGIKLWCEIESFLNLAVAVDHYPDAGLWWECYESGEAHDNGEELLNLYRHGGKSKADRLRIYKLESYFINEDIE